MTLIVSNDRKGLAGCWVVERQNKLQAATRDTFDSMYDLDPLFGIAWAEKKNY